MNQQNVGACVHIIEKGLLLHDGVTIFRHVLLYLATKCASLHSMGIAYPLLLFIKDHSLKLYNLQVN